MITAVLFGTLFILVLSLAYKKFLYRERREGEPPLVPGHFIFGNAKEFSENAVSYLQNVRKEMGKIFTLRLINKHVTIIMDPHSVQAMAKEKRFDFDPIQEQVNWNVFSFKLVNAKDMLKHTARKVRGEHMERGMQNFHNNLMDSMDALTPDSNMSPITDVSEWQTELMRDMTSKTLFYSIFTTIFGKDPSDQFQPININRSFDTFHKYFNYLWLGAPVKLFPEAAKALDVLCKQPSADELLERNDLSEYIRFSIEYMKSQGQTESDILGHSLVFLHVNYNSFRLAYWCMYYLMKHKQAHSALLNEIQQTIQNKSDSDHPTAFSTAEVEKMAILDSVIKETIRLTSGVFVIRYVTEDVQFSLSDGQMYNCRKGDQVAFYPPSLHKDPEVFEQPQEFVYDRFVDATFYEGGKELKTPVMGFGTLCPGKRYAMLQVKWFLLAMTHMFDYHLVDGETTQIDVRYHGHEILPPTNDVTIRFRRKNMTGPTISLV